MRKRDELTDPGSCLNRARDDEWLFVLLGRDISAPFAVRAWVEHRIASGKNRRDDLQIVEAERWAAAVLAEHRQRDAALAEGGCPISAGARVGTAPPGEDCPNPPPPPGR